MSQTPTATETEQASQSSERPRSERTTRGGGGTNQRNHNLATIASAAKGFKGKIPDLPVMSKPYENMGAPFQIFQKELADYAIVNIEYGDDLVLLIEDLKDNLDKAIGEAPKWVNTDKDDYGKKTLFNKEIDLYVKRKALYNRNKKKLYAIIFNQCTPSLVSSIKSQNGYSEKDKEKDPLWILKEAKKLTVGIDALKNELVTACYALRSFFLNY